MNSEELEILVKLKDEASAAFKSMGEKLSKTSDILQKDVSGLAKGMLGATVAVGGLAVAFGVSAVKEANAAQRSIAQLDAVLKSTGHAAGLFREDILDQASALQRLTIYGDDTIVSMQNLLLTFTKVQGPVFQEATGLVLDMATAMGTDLNSAAIQVGKALNDPILGVSALSRVGVQFTEQQKEQIATLVESGKVMEAQRIILAELTTQFGGSAAAAAGTFEGRLIQLNNTWSDMKEQIGFVLIDALMPFVTQFQGWLNDPTTKESFDKWTQDFKSWAEVIIPVVIDVFKLWASVLSGIFDTIIKIGDGISSLISKLGEFRDKAQSSFKQAQSGALGKILGRASGGPVSAMTPYIVGERGPELFVPNQNGTIIPNGVSGGMAITININGGMYLSEDAAETMGDLIISRLKMSNVI